MKTIKEQIEEWKKVKDADFPYEWEKALSHESYAQAIQALEEAYDIILRGSYEPFRIMKYAEDCTEWINKFGFERPYL